MVTQNKSANTIVVRASAPMLGMIAQNMIETADKPRAEVLIEVTILEVDRQRDEGPRPRPESTYAIGLTFSPEGRPAGGAVIPPMPAPPIQAGNVRAGSGATNMYLTLPSAVINLMESDQKTKLLAKPQLRGREGSQLTLNLGDSVPVPQTTFLPVATGGVATQPQVSYAYQSVGVNLSITRARDVSGRNHSGPDHGRQERAWARTSSWPARRCRRSSSAAPRSPCACATANPICSPAWSDRKTRNWRRASRASTGSRCSARCSAT